MQSMFPGAKRRKNNGYANASEKNREDAIRPEVLIRRKINPISPPTTVELKGVSIHFPFRPYKCQEAYMAKVLDALNRSENALLESPTGTGKTLCLLCSTLAWQRSQETQLLRQPQANLKKEEPFQSTNNDGNDPTAAGTAAASQTPKPQQTPTIIYASRTHSQLSQVVRELRNTRYRPPHAVLGSREQMCVHPKVKKPTSTASDINHDCGRLCKERKCRFRNALEGFTPPSSEVTESHGASDMATAAGAPSQQQPVLDMEDLVHMGKTLGVCPFYYTRGLVENAHLILVPYNYLFDRDARETTMKDVPWENSVVIFDEAHNLESFASDSASFDLSNTDIAGCISEVDRAIGYLQMTGGEGNGLKPENLVRLKALFFQLEEYILHQLSEKQTAFSGEFMMHIFHAGANITHQNYNIFIDEIRKINDLLIDSNGTGSNRGLPKLEHFVGCLKRVFGHELESKCLAKSRFYRVHVSQTKQLAYQGGGAANRNKPSVNRTISYWCFAPALAMEELANLKVRSILVTSGTLSPLPSYSMELGLPFPHTLENPHIIGDDQIHVRVIGKGVSGKLLTSSYERRKDDEYYAELGNTLVSLAKNIPAGVLVFFPSYGVMESCLDKWGGPSTGGGQRNNNKQHDFFQQRKKKKTSNQYVFPQVPASFYKGNSSSSSWGPWKKLLAVKSVVLEPRSSAELPDVISEFQRLLKLPKSPGCFLMGVCRGKISEGIDFADDMSRAVVITGIPFAPSMDAKVKLKREYLDNSRASAAVKASNGGGFGVSSNAPPMSMKLSGNDWYTQQAHRAVNQAVGRVIRSKRDYGAVLLLDSRFDQPRNQEGLSKWVRPHVRKDEGFSTALKDLTKFYKEIEQKSFEVVVPEPAPPAYPKFPSGPSRDENNENEKVAVVDGTIAATSTYVAPANVTRMKVDELKGPSSHPPPLPSTAPKQPPSFDGAFEKKAQLKVRAPKPAQPNPAAARFMEILSSFPIGQQSSIRKAIVTMKKSSSGTDSRAFLQQLRHVMELILDHEKINEPQKPNDRRLFFTLFELLPPAHLSAAQSMAIKLVFEQSAINDLGKRYLVPADYKKFKNALLPLLKPMWFGSDNGTQLDGRYVLSQIQSIVGILVKCEKQQPQSLCAALTKLVPIRLRDQAAALIEEKQVSQAMKNARSHDNRKDQIDMRRFALPSQRSYPLMSLDSSRSETKNDSVEQKKQVPGQNSTHMETTNPYARPLGKPKTEPSTESNRRMARPGETKPTSQPVRTHNPYAAAAKPSIAGKNGPRMTTNPYQKRTGSTVSSFSRANDLKSMLQKIESDSFVHQEKKVNSNAPKDLSCSICNKSLPEPYMADCHHLACLECWNSWLSRQSTCMSCRLPVSKSNLVRVIFKNSSTGK